MELSKFDFQLRDLGVRRIPCVIRQNLIKKTWMVKVRANNFSVLRKFSIFVNGLVYFDNLCFSNYADNKTLYASG